MKRILMLCAGLCALVTGFAQDDSTAKKNPDTLRIGGMVIIREPGNDRDHDSREDRWEKFKNHKPGKRSPVTTNWIVVDFGFSNYADDTKYGTAPVNAIANGSTKDWFKLRTISSVNFDLWFFMQRISLIKRAVNFKYGLGIEFNNYRLNDKTVHVDKNPLMVYQDPAYDDLKKNKLAADYITMPFMLNVNFTPNKRRPVGFSGGVSVGYLLSARQKVKEDGGEKHKTKGLDFDEWKIAYVGEVSLGIIHLYGSYAMESLFTNNNLNMTPYTVGLRFSNW
jgi:hypothetical protein